METAMRVKDENEITIKANEEAVKKAEEKWEAVRDNATPVVSPSSPDVSFEPPAEKSLDAYEKYASNDGTLVLSKLDDGTSVAQGNIMENQAREPAHQQHELAFEEDAPGFEQSGSLMTARHSAHYDEGGSVAEVNTGKAYGEA
jgi:hypothetical protein